MEKMETDDIISKLSKEYNVNIIQVINGDEHCIANGVDNYISTSHIAGDTMWVGIYTDENLKIASIFHEFGHKIITQEFIKSVNYNSRAIEREVWKIGFELAKTYDIYFPIYVYKWAVKNFKTYKDGYEKR